MDKALISGKHSYFSGEQQIILFIPYLKCYKKEKYYKWNHSEFDK